MATRRKRRPVYKNPKAPKDQGSGDRKEFRVMPHASLHIVDEDGVTRKYSGRQAELDAGPEGEAPQPVYVALTEEMATFYANLGYIEVELDFATEKDAEIVQLHKDNKRLTSELGDAEELRRRIAELEAQLAGSEEVHSDGENAESDDAALSAVIASGTDSPSTADGAEDVAGDHAIGGGTEPSGGPSGGSEPETKKRVPRRRRKAS